MGHDGGKISEVDSRGGGDGVGGARVAGKPAVADTDRVRGG